MGFNETNLALVVSRESKDSGVSEGGKGEGKVRVEGSEATSLRY